MSFEDHPINKLNAAGAPEFVSGDPKVLLERAIAHFEAGTGRKLSRSQVEMYLLETIAYMLALPAAEQQLAFENSFVAYARSEFLDVHGADRELPRLEAVAATTTLEFSVTDPAQVRIRIPSGTRVSNAAGQPRFATDNVAYIEVGEISVIVSATAQTTGVAGNGFAPGEILSLIDPVPPVTTVANTTESTGGAARESDGRYRARLPGAFERIGGGVNQERYASDVFAWSANCIDVHIDRPQAGHVNIYPLMNTGAPTEAERASLAAVFDQSNTHQGDFIQIFAPREGGFSFALHLTVSDPDAAQGAQAAAQSVLDNWRTKLGGYVAPSEITLAARSVSGVIEADIPDLSFAEVDPAAFRVGAISGVTVVVV